MAWFFSAIIIIAIVVVVNVFYRSYRFYSLLKLKGISKVVLVTGAGSGLGLEACKLFADRGWTVFAVDINRIALEELNSLAKSMKWTIFTQYVDISSTESCDQLLESITQYECIKKSGLSALVNCAGIAMAGPCLGIKWNQVELQWRVNIIGAMYITRIFYPLLLQGEDGGNIVNISSMAGRAGWPWQGAYSATKFALEGNQTLPY
jgi:NAD(P)-dependent dehydrogenase (short-subunit alcohol dehydrogenase family)